MNKKSVYFYLLKDDSSKTYTRSVCGLIDQWWQKGLTTHLYCPTIEVAKQFDDDLWTFKDTHFLPHAIITEGMSYYSQLPCCTIGFAGQKLHPPKDILFNLTHHLPDFFKEYQRIVELVSTNEISRSKSRELYKHYQKARYPIETKECPI